MSRRGFGWLATCALLVLCLGGGLATASSAAGDDDDRTGVITGRILASDTGQPLPRANVVLVGTRYGRYASSDGSFTIDAVPRGTYVVELSHVGYRTERIEDLLVTAGRPVRLDVELEPAPLRLDEIVVTPGRFAVMGRGPTVRQALTRQDLETIPFGEDIYRAVRRLPGVASGDFGAKFTVRGSKDDDVLVLMDGQELYEPFHLKDVDGGLLSILDVEAVEDIDLYTGGYPARFGECLGGVLDMRSSAGGIGRTRTSLGLSLMNARLMSEGSFRQDRGSWLLSARRGYLDLVLALMDEEDPPEPVYYDIFGKARYALSATSTLTASVLHSSDRLDFVEDDDDRVRSSYGNSYGWVTLQSLVSPGLFARTTASFGRITRGREGLGFSDVTGDVDYTIDEAARSRLLGVKQDWDLDLSERDLLHWGIYYSHESADYDYESDVVRRDCTDPDSCSSSIDSTDAVLEPAGTRFGGYLSNRFQLGSQLTVEAGVRLDRNGYTGDRHLSPRLGVAYALRPQTFLRAGWGLYRQSQRVHDIPVAYGETTFHRAELARHWVVGLEHTLSDDVNLRAEGYYKTSADLRPAHHRFSDSIEMFPEIEDDVHTVTFDRATSKGLELYARYHEEGRWSCWGSYALSRVEETVRDLVYQGETHGLDDPVVPGRHDQRHAVHLDVSFQPSRAWDLNVAWKYHSGWPCSPQVLETQQLPDGSIEQSVRYDFRQGRFSPYHRMDVQVRRHFGSPHNRLSVCLTVINVYDHGNVRDVKYSRRLGADGVPHLVAVEEYWFGLLPSLGVQWTWGG